jgi:UDP-N-acetyl-D-glucosamine dehydrogenase
MDLIQKIKTKDAKVGVIGLGYVGLPLVMEFCKAGFSVVGFDVDPNKIVALKEGRDYIKHIHFSSIGEASKRLLPTTDFSELTQVDCIIICVPTPLNKYREPDMSYVLTTTETIAKYLRPHQLVILESTTYPGTTDGEMKAILERTGLKAGKDFYLAFSPEREDPSNKDFSTSTIPKVVGGYTAECLAVSKALYDTIIVRTVPVSSTRVAEAAKILENTYRAVNIALVNELKMLFDKMDINIWEVIEASKTKPFGFQPFYPGPGLGGHCIPIDPFYLTWKAREYGFATRFIELAGEINTGMPVYVVNKVADALNTRGKSVKGVSILILGVAYKKDIDDLRESPALELIELLTEKGAKVDYNDPYIPEAKGMRHYDFIMKSVPLNDEMIKKYDVVLIATAHSDYDYKWLFDHASLIVDTRNAMKDFIDEKVIRA